MSIPKYVLSSHRHKSLHTLHFCPRQVPKLLCYANPVTPNTDESYLYSNCPSVSREGSNIDTDVNFVHTTFFPPRTAESTEPMLVGRMPCWKQDAATHIALHEQANLPEAIGFLFGIFCDDSDALYSSYPHWKHKHTYTGHWKGVLRWLFNRSSDLDFYKGKTECFVHMKPGLAKCYFRTAILNSPFKHKWGGVFVFCF